MFSVQTGMKYMEFNLRNPRCIHCYISDRAYASVITEVLSNGKNETGGVFLGYIINRAWYIVESVDPGMQTVNQVAFFQWDTDYVNYQADRLGKIYNIPLTILGFWHRHPGSMDYFSATDEKTIGSNLRQLRAGLLSMLVNIDPKLRMTFYYCYGNEIMPIRYDVGNRYFPVELLQYADAKELSRREAKKGRTLEIHYEKVIDLDAIAKKKRSGAAPSPSADSGQPRSEEQQAKPQPAVWSRQPEESAAAGGETADRQAVSQGQTRQLTQELADVKKQLAELSAKLDLVLEKFSPKSQGEAEKQSAAEQKEEEPAAQAAQPLETVRAEEAAETAETTEPGEMAAAAEGLQDDSQPAQQDKPAEEQPVEKE